MVNINSKWEVISGKWFIKHFKWLGVLLFAAVYSLLPAPRLYGYSLLGVNNQGDMVSGFSARSIGMGSVDITAANDSSALASNPAAMLNTTARRLIVSASPVYNVFEEQVNGPSGFYTDYDYNRMKLNIGGAASYLHYGGSDLFNRIIVGIHTQPVTDTAYRYSKKIYLPSGALSYDKTLDYSGGMNETDIGLGLEVIEEIYLGFAYGIYSGETPLKDKYITYNNNNAVKDIRNSDTNTKYDGSSMKYGLILTKLDYSFGAFYQPGAVVTAKTSGTSYSYSNITDARTTTTEDYEVESKLPEKFGLGFSYRFKDKYRTLFAVDYVRQNWNAFTSTTTFRNGAVVGTRKEYQEGYGRTQEIKVGFQHWLNDWIPVRYGFRLQQFYKEWNNTVDNFYNGTDAVKKEKPAFYCVSLGSGYVVGYFDFDFGYEFGKRSYTDQADHRYDDYLQKYAFTARWRW